MFKNQKPYIMLLAAFAVLSPIRAQANNYVDYFNESVLKVTPEEKIKVAAALGIGSHLNSITLRDEKNNYALQTTNRNLYLLGLSINDRTQFLLQIPFKDPAQSRASRVDSDVRLYSATYNWTPTLATSFSYFKNKGYMFLSSEGTMTQLLLPGISIDKYSAMFFYSSNSEHQSIFIDPIIYKHKKDSSAWITSLGFDHTDMTNLQDMAILPSLKKSFLTSAHIDSLLARISYSKNWFWEHWHATAAVGLGLYAHSIKAFSDTDQMTRTNTPIAGLLSLSTGYIWTNFSSGCFLNTAATPYQFENIDLSMNTGNSGLFVSYQF